MNETTENKWTEDESEIFIKYGDCFVPQKERQIEILIKAIPKMEKKGIIVELCCGSGDTCKALLENIPKATVWGMDLSQKMLDETKRKNKEYSDRIEVKQFDLAEMEWRTFPQPVHAFVSSLAVHHLDAAQKKALFKDLYGQLEPGGALIIADLMYPNSPESKKIFADNWDEETQKRSLEIFGSESAYEAFKRTEWNYYSDPNAENDPIDKPSSLYDQLKWLEEAGFASIEVFWASAGHAVYGGFKK